MFQRSCVRKRVYGAYEVVSFGKKKKTRKMSELQELVGGQEFNAQKFALKLNSTHQVIDISNAGTKHRH